LTGSRASAPASRPRSSTSARRAITRTGTTSSRACRAWAKATPPSFSAEGLTVNGAGFSGAAAAPAKKEEKPVAKDAKPAAKADEKKADAKPAAAAASTPAKDTKADPKAEAAAKKEADKKAKAEAKAKADDEKKAKAEADKKAKADATAKKADDAKAKDSKKDEKPAAQTGRRRQAGRQRCQRSGQEVSPRWPASGPRQRGADLKTRLARVFSCLFGRSPARKGHQALHH
jgi:hypothetical protein